jgi:parallel beta-helix repeat protein
VNKSFCFIGSCVIVLSIHAIDVVTHPSIASEKRNAAVADATVYPATDGSDQADALQQAINGLQIGQRLVFAPGQYIVGHSLVVNNAQVVLSGYGAKLVATNPNDQTIDMSGTNSTILGFTLIGTGTTRLTTPSSTKVEVTGTGIQVLDVKIRGGASAGIFIFGGTNVVIAGNTVRDTLADGIHTTYGSQNVLVQGNTVTGTGDDMVAVVSYQSDGKLSSNVLITGNTLSNNYWGRGISVVGGSNVSIIGNSVQGVQKAAGILVAQEDGWRTFNASNVLIEKNVVSNIQNSTNINSGLLPTEQAAIELDTGAGTVTQVSVMQNQVYGSAYAGFRALGNVCQFLVSGNALTSITGTPISLLTMNCPQNQMVVGGSNTLNGKQLMPPAGSVPTGILNVIGANLALLPRVRNSLRQTTKASLDADLDQCGASRPKLAALAAIGASAHWPRACGNSIFAAEGEVAGRVDQVKCVELALIEHRERKTPLGASASNAMSS